jgi:hypothetical protein
MKVVNYKTNQQLLVTPAFTCHMSYGVPQVVVWNKERLTLVTTKRYSNTTNKHRNAAVRDLHPSNFTMIEATPAEIQEITGIETA